MESSDSDRESVKISDSPCDYANTDQMMMGTDVSLAPCGSCEGCNVTEDCGTTCENCVNNYIQTAIENRSNPNLLPCLKTMCHAKKRNVRSRPTASSSSQSSTSSSSVSRTQSASTSTTEAEDGAIGGVTTRAVPSIPESGAAQARSASATSSSNAREDTSAGEGPSPVGVHPHRPSELPHSPSELPLPHSPGELPLPDWDTTVDLTSPARPSITRSVFNPIMRRLQQDQGDITHDFSELTFTSPPSTPPRNVHIGEWSPRPNRSILVDNLQPVDMDITNMDISNIDITNITIDLTDSPGPAPAASASPEGNTLDPAPGSTSHIKCPVCLDDLPQISSTRRNLMSTVCGHVFCSSCLPLCIRSNGRCPSCRKLLNPNQIHPIFL